MIPLTRIRQMSKLDLINKVREMQLEVLEMRKQWKLNKIKSTLPMRLDVYTEEKKMVIKFERVDKIPNSKYGVTMSEENAQVLSELSSMLVNDVFKIDITGMYPDSSKDVLRRATNKYQGKIKAMIRKLEKQGTNKVFTVARRGGNVYVERSL